MILKNGVSTEEVKIYDLYLQRWAKEADLIWSRFKIYFGFNSIVFVAIGFILKPYIDAKPNDISSIPNFIWRVLLCLSIFGFLSSMAWFFVCRSGRHWQLVIDEGVVKVEADIFQIPKEGLYNRIKADYDFDSKWWQIHKRLDVMDISIYMSILYTVIFVGLAVCTGLQI